MTFSFKEEVKKKFVDDRNKCTRNNRFNTRYSFQTSIFSCYFISSYFSHEIVWEVSYLILFIIGRNSKNIYKGRRYTKIKFRIFIRVRKFQSFFLVSLSHLFRFEMLCANLFKNKEKIYLIFVGKWEAIFLFLLFGNWIMMRKKKK